MGAFIQKNRLMLVSTFILFLLYGLHYSFHRRSRTLKANTNNAEQFQNNAVIIHRYLFEIYSLTTYGRIDEAEDTFLNMKQFWYTQDILAKPSQGHTLNMTYFPSDSLVKLEKLLRQMYEEKSAKQLASVSQEIKRIQECVDKSEIPVHTK